MWMYRLNQTTERPEVPLFITLPHNGVLASSICTMHIQRIPCRSEIIEFSLSLLTKLFWVCQSLNHIYLLLS